MAGAPLIWSVWVRETSSRILLDCNSSLEHSSLWSFIHKHTGTRRILSCRGCFSFEEDAEQVVKIGISLLLCSGPRWSRQRWSPRFRSLENYAVIIFFFKYLISYIVSPENLKCYYIHLGRTIGYKSDVNLPSIRPGRLSRSGSFVRTSTLDMRSYPSGRPKKRGRGRRGRQNGLLVRLWRRAHHPLLPSILLTDVQSLDNKMGDIRDTLDPLQFAYRLNRSTDDANTITLHTALSHLDERNTYVRMLFINYSSAFNTILPSKPLPNLRH